MTRTVALLGSMLACACQAPRSDSSSTTTPPTAREWDVTLQSAGPVRFGVRPGESSAPADSGCTYWVPPGAPAGLRIMLENGIAVRVDVDSAGSTTIGGLGVGSPVESVVVALGPSLQVSPHKYQWDAGWRYLTFSDDSAHRLVFEVDSHVVRTWRAGLVPAVEYVEGCS